MDARGFAARAHDLPAGQRRGVIALILGATFAVSWWSLTAQSPDIPIALWWPAAGVGVVAVLASRGRRLGVALLLALVGALANVAGGRPLDLAIAYGIANAIELWIVVRVLTRGREHARFVSLTQIGWFLFSVAVGTLSFAGIAGVAAAALAGADFWAVSSSLVTSHASALFALAPVALVPLTIPLRVPRWEPLVQWLALVFLTVVVFGLAGSLALTFLIITTLMWGAYRLTPIIVATQSVVLAVAATVTTAAGFGPFATLIAADQRGAIFALQLFIMTHAAAGLFVSGQSADWRAATDRLAARERDATHVAESLRQLNVQKDDFISAVSHELRTPVTSILGFSEQLVETQLDAETEQAGRIIHRNARRLADVIEDVLELSRLSTTEGSNRPPADLDIAQLVRDCVDDIVGLGRVDRPMRVDLRLPEQPVVIHAVAPDLVRIVSNLLSNAVKFSPVGGTVTVHVIEHESEVEVRVDDEGPGIPPAEQEAVWERFYRVQSPRHRDVPGTGLGLPIVRALVEHRVGGSVSLSSDGEHGTSVAVRIPRTPRPMTAPRHPTAV